MMTGTELGTSTTPDDATYRQLLDHIDECDVCGGMEGRYCSEGYRVHRLVRDSQTDVCAACGQPIEAGQASRLAPADGRFGAVGSVRLHTLCPVPVPPDQSRP